MSYNTVITGKRINRDVHRAAARLIDRSMFITPSDQDRIDRAIGIGTRELPKRRVRQVSEPIFGENETDDILVGPTQADLRKIEREDNFLQTT